MWQLSRRGGGLALDAAGFPLRDGTVDGTGQEPAGEVANATDLCRLMPCPLFLASPRLPDTEKRQKSTSEPLFPTAGLFSHTSPSNSQTPALNPATSGLNPDSPGFNPEIGVTGSPCLGT